MTPSARERGVALILVIVMLPLVAVIMTQLHFETAVGDRLAANTLANQQFKLAIRGRLNQMRLRLVRDLTEQAEQEAQYDTYADEWGPDVDGGGTAVSMTIGGDEEGEGVTIYTEVVDEQGKLNLNLLLHSDPKRAARAAEMLAALLDLYRDGAYRDMEANEWDLGPGEAQEVAQAIVRFVQGEERDPRIPKPDVPAPSEEMRQGVYTVRDLVFAHRLFQERRLLDDFVDPASDQRIPGLGRFVTVHGDGRINANTAPIQVLRAMFREEYGRTSVAEGILHGRGGFLNTDEDLDEQEREREERREARERGEEEEEPEEGEGAYQTPNDIARVEGMGDAPFLRRNEIDVGRDFTVSTNFFEVTVTAQHGNFLRQHRVVLQRHAAGCLTLESEVVTSEAVRLPQGASASSGSEPAP